MMQNKSITPSTAQSLKVYNPKVDIYHAINSEETLLHPEHALNLTEMANESSQNEKKPANNRKQFLELKNIDLCIPPKEKITNLITPNSLQSEVLLSVVNNSEYKELQRQKELRQINLHDSMYDSLQPLSLMSSHAFSFYNENNENESLSLMEELVLLDNVAPSPSGKSWPSNFCMGRSRESATANMDSGFEEENSFSDFNCTKLDSIQSTDSTSAVSHEKTDSVEVLSDNLKELKLKTAEMRNELFVIRRDFYEEDLRISRLLKEAKVLQEKLEKKKCLDDYINLLTGNPEKVNSNLWPFRICVENETPEMNFIV